MRRIDTAPHRLIEATLDTLLAEVAGPDYASALIVMGNIRAAPRLKREFAERAAGESVFLPRVVPWSQMIEHDAGGAGRLAVVYTALKTSGQFADVPLWPLAREVLALVDEFTRERVSVARDFKSFQAAFVRAFQATQNPHFEFEAAIVHRVWAALHQHADAAMPPEAEAAVLSARVNAQLQAPDARVLFVDCPFTRIHETALTDTGSRVAALYPAASLWLSDADVAQSRFAPLSQVVTRVTGGKPRAQMDIFSQQAATAASVVQCYNARSLADEAMSAAHTLGNWLDQGLTQIALVSFDRKLARRLGALLEADGVLVADEHGWPLPTTSAAMPVLRWLDAVADDFHHQPLADLLSSPFAFGAHQSTTARDESRHALAELRHLADRHRWSRGLKRLTRLAAGADVPALRQRLAACEMARAHYPKGRATLTQWFEGHSRALKSLGLDEGLGTDAAGKALLAQFDELRTAFADSDIAFGADEWQALYRDTLASARFVDPDIDSPVILTTLAATTGRAFDAVMLLGASEANFVGSLRGSALLSETARQQLRLTGRRENRERALVELLALLATTPHIYASWQGQHAREPGALAAWLVPLAADSAALAAAPNDLANRAGQLPREGQAPPAPIAPADLIPQKLAVSAWQSLLDCPYQFFATRVLGLREAEGASDEIDTGALGDAAHALLDALHQQFALFSAASDEALISAIDNLAQQHYAPLAAIDYRSRAEWLRWRDVAPHYIAWQREREAQGWRYLASESSASLPLAADENARQFVLFGRMDRIDVRVGDVGEELAVLDYKTARAEGLKRAAADSDNTLQLPAYAALAPWATLSARIDRVAQAAYVALPRSSGAAPETITTRQAPDAAAKSTVARLTEWAAALAGAVALPAHGDLSACRYCKVSGLCRRDWHGEGRRGEPAGALSDGSGTE